MSSHSRFSTAFSCAITVLIFSASVLRAQNVTGSISGIVQDAQGAVIPNAKVTLTNAAQGAGSARVVNTNGEGAFVFSPVLAGTYELSIEVMGFKRYVQSNIILDASDKLGLPPIALEVGQTGESVTVEATAIQLQTLNGERTAVVTGNQMVDIALNGRNYTNLLRTVPGVTADSGATSSVTDVSFNGLPQMTNNYTVDGQNVTDIGVNQQFAYRISVDSIAEFNVATNSQGAEFGRTSGAQIQVVTKSGTKDFHGNGYWFKRGEWMNANTFINNAAGIPIQPYRFMTAGWTLGGPIYIPRVFNTHKDKLFGFMSQEWNRNLIPNTLRQITVPTAAQRTGNFAGTVNGAGVPQIIYDPLNRSASTPQGTPFPGNIIPASRISQLGAAALDWIPLPNTFGQPGYNYQSQVPNSQPSFDQIYRVDYNLSDKWRFYVRGLTSKQTQNVPYGRADTSNNLALTPFIAPTYGWSITTNVATIITPTLTNEFQFGYTVNGIPGNPPPAGSPYYRSVSNITIPQLYPAANIASVIPNFYFTGVPVGPGGCAGAIDAMTCFAGTPYFNRNPVWNYIDNVTKVRGTHTIKAGVYYEYAVKTENAFKPYNGTIDFGNDINNPCDTNWGFSNALTGCYQSYSQISQDPLPNYPYKNFEFYGQDTWKITKRLTLNYGMRVSWVIPFHDSLGLMSNFLPSQYNASQSVTFYQPALQNGQRVAVDPTTGAILPAVYVGAIVPGVGNINNGLVRSGQNGTPEGLVENRGPQWGPRFGVAYQINDKTVFRAGGGVFYTRTATFPVGITSNYTTNPPLTRTAQLYYGSLANIGSTGSTFFPTGFNMLSPDGHIPTVYNWNAGIQRQLPLKLFADVSYVGNVQNHAYLAQPINYAPFGSAWLPQNQDPTVTPKFDGTTTLPANFYRPYAGYTNATDYTWGTNTNYSALQASLNRRSGRLQLGANYNWSKALGVGVGHPTDTRGYGYGPLSQDRTQSLSINYIYDIPGPAKGSFLGNAAGQLILGGWQIAGLTSVATGAPVTPSYSVSGIGATTLNQMITGSADVAPRVILTCNPNLSRGDRNLNAFINTSCFAPAPKGSIGEDSSYNPMRGPGLQQWDMSLYKNISIKERARIQLRLEAYNAFNHAEWGSVNSAAIFNTAGKLINLPTQLGGTGGRYGFGALNTIRASSNRILQIGAKFYF